MAEGTIPIDNMHARILFDPGVTHSFISNKFTELLQNRQIVDTENMSICTPSGERARTSYAISKVDVLVEENIMPTYVYLLEMIDFDVILGIDLLIMSLK